MFVSTDHNFREPELIVMELAEVLAELVADDDHDDIAEDGVAGADNITGHEPGLLTGIGVLLTTIRPSSHIAIDHRLPRWYFSPA